MRSLTIKRDANAVSSRENRADLCTDFSRGVSQHMLSERHIRLGNAVAQAVVNHRFRAATDLFRRLKQCYKGSTPRLLSVSEEVRRAQQTRHMRVMAASMCDTHG